MDVPEDEGSVYRKMSSNPSELVKVCLLGDMGVGKTSLAVKFVEGEFFARYRPSFHMNHLERRIKTDKKSISMLIWDTAGTERFRSLTSHYLRGASACLLVFDITDRESFLNVKNYWFPKVREWQPGLPCFVVANKVDLAEKMGWALSLREVVKFCFAHKLKFFETSAKTGQNIESCFLEAADITDEVSYEVEGQEGFTDSFRLNSVMEGYSYRESPRRLLDEKLKKKSAFDCCVIL